MLWPEPYVPLIGLLVVTPIVAMTVALANHDRRGEADAQTSRGLLALAGFPAMVLLIRVSDLQLLNWGGLFLAALVFTVILVVFAARIVPIANLKTLGALLALSFSYAWGALAQINVQLDFQRPVVDWVEVTGKRTGKYDYTLEFEEREGLPSDGDVAQRFYDGVKVGDRVCLLVYPGALGARWFDVAHCPARFLLDRDISAEPAP